MSPKLLLASFIVAFSLISNTHASKPPTNPKKQTPWGLYVNAKEAYDLKTKLGEKALFVDVRDPVEIQFTGYTDVVDINVPFMLANSKKWNTKKSVLQMEKNPDYIPDLEQALVNKGLSKEDTVILMCRSGGTRGAPAANVLYDRGFKKVYVVTDGFEGGTLKQGENKGWRLKNGWKNSKLPWSYKLNKDKMYYKNKF